MDYWVISVKWNDVERSPLNFLFATPFQAETYLRNMALGHVGYRYEVRPATWREREERMFHLSPATGEAIYQPPVWSEERWWTECMAHFKDHFVHISAIDPTAVAFTEDERKGEADRQTMIRPGKYLQKFLGAGASGTIEHGPLKGWAPQITKMQIAFYASWHQSGKRPPSDETLIFTEDGDEMVRLYEEGPESCMMGKGWDTDRHPVQVYAGGGLALAALVDADGDVVGRALCWPANEVFGRVYPTPNTPRERERYDELMARLKAKGWKSITEDNSVFEGALLRQITSRYGSYVMPYLDNDYGVRDVYRNGKSWWEMTHDEDHQDNPDGTMNGHEPDWHCDSCSEGFSDDDYNYTVYDRWVPSPGRRRGHGYARGEETWCESCRDNDAFYCDGSDEHYRSGNSIYAANGNTYEQSWFEANGGWQCCVDDEYYFDDEDTPVRLADGSLMHADNVEGNAFRCQADGQMWSIEFHSDAVPGYHHHYDTADPHPVEMEHVLPAMPDDPVDVAAWATAYARPVDEDKPPPPVEEDTGSIEGFVTPRAWADISRMPAPVITPISI
jgi:hypothetical protein